MNCDDYKKLMIDFFESGLSQKENELLNKHLEECNSCKSEFEELKKLFVTLEKENQIFLIESEKYIQSIDVDEVISKKKKKKWYEFQFKPSFAVALIFLISLAIYFSLINVNSLNDKNISSEESSTETTSTDFVSSYLNQDYIYENIDETSLPQSNYFKDVINFIDELPYSTLSGQDFLNYLNSTISNLDEKEVDELIAQLESKKFSGE
jgi:hypothetical protein